MRARSDWFAKQLALGVLPDLGVVRTEHEVLTDPQRIDIWFEPTESGRATAVTLGLFGRIASEPCILEAFHNVPGEGQFRDVIRKQLTLLRDLERREPQRWDSPPAAWVISSGRPDTAMASFGLLPRRGWPRGCTAPCRACGSIGSLRPCCRGGRNRSSFA